MVEIFLKAHSFPDCCIDIAMTVPKSENCLKYNDLNRLYVTAHFQPLLKLPIIWHYDQYWAKWLKYGTLSAKTNCDGGFLEKKFNFKVAFCN